MNNNTSTIKRTAWSKAGRIALAGALALGTMGVSSPATALAEDGTVTINSSQAQGTIRYDAYRLFTATIDDENNATNIAWASDATKTAVVSFLTGNANPDSTGYDVWLQAKGETANTDNRNNAQNACEYISEMISASTGTGSPVAVNAGSFADMLAKAVVAGVSSVGTATSGTAYQGPEGYYLFMTDSSTLGSAYMASAPIWFALGGSATTVNEKAGTGDGGSGGSGEPGGETGTPGSALSIAKTVEEDATGSYGEYADAEIGQAVNYKLVVDIPSNYNTFSEYSLKVADQLGGGLAMADTSSVTLKDAKGNDITSNFTCTLGNGTLTIENSNIKGISSIEAGSQVTITYAAYLTGDSVVYGGTGNSGTATYTYSNDPYALTTGSTSDEAVLYTYTLTVDKLDKSTAQALAGATFVIKNAAGKYLTDSGWTATTELGAKTFTSASDGTITGINGLDAGDTYTLIETVAPGGYNKAGETSIEITPTYGTDGTLTLLAVSATGSNVSASSADAANGTVNVDVNNIKDVGLAMTGGMGAGLIGIAVLAGGVAWYLKRRRDGKADAIGVAAKG